MNHPFYETEVPDTSPSSPGISSFLAELAAEDMDSFGNLGDVSSHQDTQTPNTQVEYMGYFTSMFFPPPSGQPLQQAAVAQFTPGPSSFSQPSLQTGNLYLPNVIGTVAQAIGPASGSALMDLGPATTKPLPFSTHECPSQPTACALSCSRRGRKPLPRLTDLERHLDVLTKQYQLLSQENAFLRSKLKLLERVLPYRDAHISFLVAVNNGQLQAPKLSYHWTDDTAGRGEQRAPSLLCRVLAAASNAPPLLPAAAASPFIPAISASKSSVVGISPWPPSAASSGPSGAHVNPSTSLSPGTSRPASGRFDSTPTADAAHLTATLPGNESNGKGGGDRGGRQPEGHEACQRLPGLLPGASASGLWATTPPSLPACTPAVIALCPGPDGEVPEVTLEAVKLLKSTTTRDFQLLYKHCIMQVGLLLVSAEVHGPSSPHHARLERFLERIFVYLDHVLLLSPSCLMNSLYVNIETGQQERPSQDFWRAIGLSLSLTPQQLEEVRMLMVMYTSAVAPVTQQRVRLAGELAASISAAAGQQPVGSGDVMKTLSDVDELAERLHRNVIKEHQAQMDVGDFLCTGLLTPTQVARAMVSSYPFLPDGVALIHSCDPDMARDAQKASGM